MAQYIDRAASSVGMAGSTRKMFEMRVQIHRVNLEEVQKNDIYNPVNCDVILPYT